MHRQIPKQNVPASNSHSFTPSSTSNQYVHTATTNTSYCPLSTSNGMPSFFNFQQGHDPHGATTDSSPLLGRFRAVPDAPRRNVRHRNSLSLLGSFTNGSAFGRGYGGVFGSGNAVDGSEEDDGEGQGLIRGWVKTSRDLWLDPKQATVRRVVEKWWTRWLVLVVLPAALVSSVDLLTRENTPKDLY